MILFLKGGKKSIIFLLNIELITKTKRDFIFAFAISSFVSANHKTLIIYKHFKVIES